MQLALKTNEHVRAAATAAYNQDSIEALQAMIRESLGKQVGTKRRLRSVNYPKNLQPNVESS
jgi:hypothetical protein